jgi:rhodanese-related sulfurtransferase
VKKLLLILNFLLLLLAACSSQNPVTADEISYTNISVETLKSMLDERPTSFLLVNTHIPFQGNIPNTDINIPSTEILGNLNQLPEDKDAEIVLYCRSDRMSHTASANLVNAGYTNVKNVIGGLIAWESAGYPLEMTP